METKTNAKRQSGIEILRIIAMLLIVMQHLENHTDFPDVFTVNTVWLQVIALGGSMSVNLFVMIAGYFYTSQFTTKKVLKLTAQVTFYSVVMTIISVLCGAAEIRLKMIPRALFPLLFDGQHYWFITIYMLLFLVTPLLKPAVERIETRRLGVLILIFFALFTVFPYTVGHVLKLQDFGFSNLCWFFLMYLVGAYIRKNKEKLITHKSLACLALLGSVIIQILSCVVDYMPGEKDFIGGILWPALGHRAMNSIPTAVIAALLVIVFCDWNPKVPDIVFKISAATFGDYLIHDHLLFHDYLWYDLLKTTDKVGEGYFIPYSIACILLVYICCTIIDMLRKKYIEEPVFKNKKVNVICEKIDGWLSDE